MHVNQVRFDTFETYARFNTDSAFVHQDAASLAVENEPARTSKQVSVRPRILIQEPLIRTQVQQNQCPLFHNLCCNPWNQRGGYECPQAIWKGQPACSHQRLKAETPQKHEITKLMTAPLDSPNMFHRPLSKFGNQTSLRRLSV